MVDVGLAYAEVQRRTSELLGSLSGTELGRPVPACPAWRVRDVIAHHIGAMSDALAGGVPEIDDFTRLLDQWRDPQIAAARDAMTARQVEERRDVPTEQLLEEWDRGLARLLPILRGEQQFPGGISPILVSIAINDVVVHEGDVREALALDPAPETAAVSLALAGYGFSLDRRLREIGLPALGLRYAGKERVLGEGDVSAAVTADRTTLVRMLAARLDESQIRGLEWEGDPTPYLPVIPEYGPVRRE